MAYERKFDVDAVIEKLLRGKTLRLGQLINVSETDMRDICRISREMFLSQPMLLDLSSPVKIFSDIHGQYYDLLKIFDMCGYPPDSNYLFLGDAVDRGKQSLETICLLLCYKIKYPEKFFLLRGNHESASISRIYGFYDECKRRHNIKLWKTFMDCFNCLPVAAVVEDQIFCCHGGLSPYLRTMDDILTIQRPTDVPEKGLLCDLLWSDPGKVLGSSNGSNNVKDEICLTKSGTKDEQVKNILTNGPNAKIIAEELLSRGFGFNDRGVSFTFNDAAVNKFLVQHKLRLVCRGHQVVEDGYEFFANRTLVTIFSAPNYCGEFDNAGAVMIVDASLLCSFQILKAVGKIRLTAAPQRLPSAPPTPASPRDHKKTKNKTKKKL